MNLRKFFAAAFAAVMAAGCGAIAAQAASQPNIQIHPSGAENQYVVTLNNVESTAHGVQFDVTVDSGSEVEIDWADENNGVVQEAVQQVQGDKTTVTFYVSKTYPLSNSTQVQIAAITTEKEQKASSFHTSGNLKTVDERQQPQPYSGVKLSFQTNTSGNSEDASSWEDKDSSEQKQKENMATWDKLSGKVKTENGKKTLSITAKSGQRIESEIFRQALEKGIEVTVDYGDYQWVFHGSEGGSVPEKQKYYDLAVQFMGQKNLSAAAHNSDILQFAIAHSGQLPCPATLKLSVGSQYKGQTLYLALYNEFKGTLEKYAQAIVEDNGIIAFALEQGGKYVVVTEDLWAVSTTTSSSSSQTTATVTVPPLETEEELEKEDLPQEVQEEEKEPQEPETEKPAGPAEAQPEKKEISVVGIIIAICCMAAFGGAVAFLVMKDKKAAKR